MQGGLRSWVLKGFGQELELASERIAGARRCEYPRCGFLRELTGSALGAERIAATGGVENHARQRLCFVNRSVKLFGKLDMP